MTAFRYNDSVDPIRPDLAEAYRRMWVHLAAPGTWLTGAQRVAVADETRRASSCPLCRDRKEALSPNAVAGEHAHAPANAGAGTLSEPLVDAVHRVTTDAARLSERWVRALLDEGLTADSYVEALGVAVCVISIDRFNAALGLPLEPLPSPVAGEPTRVRPEGIVEGEAWVPMLPSKQVAAQAGLPGMAPFVLRALSLVPDEVRAWRELSAVQYLDEQQMMSFGKSRALDRSQIELVAGRVSALNECFY